VDVATAIAALASRTHWRRRLALRTLLPIIEVGTILATIGVAVTSYVLFIRGKNPNPLTPLQVSAILVAFLVPTIGSLVIIARRLARRQGKGALHVRLVALFSFLAAVPTLAVVIFASMLFQYGVEFWFSDRSRVILDNAQAASTAYVKENRERVAGDIVAMATDMKNNLDRWGRVDDPRFVNDFGLQLAYRDLTEAAILQLGHDGTRRAIAIANLDNLRPLEKRLSPIAIRQANLGKVYVATDAGDRIEGVLPLDLASHTYFYVSRKVDPRVLKQVARAATALNDYDVMQSRSRTLQLRFNGALLIVSLMIVGVAIWIALAVADRLVRPVGALAEAARKVTAGDFTTRVAAGRSRDEVAALGKAFNRMTRRLEEQTGALVQANSQLESRRSLIEAVLSGVTAGVLSIDHDRRVLLVNNSAQALLMRPTSDLVGHPLLEVAPALDRLLDEDEREAVVQLGVAADPRTLAVKIVETASGAVLTFDDITDQLRDQRHAAWADVARRIAHEIKNPLTPIQLAAERLQRRYGGEITSDQSTFQRLTGTIVRQVGDLRRMVDEFSSFARMPKPMFRREPIASIARQALFLHEVAHPAIKFRLDAADEDVTLVCDRRQIGQALTNLVKNAVEAIQGKAERDGDSEEGEVAISLREEGRQLVITVEDTGIGLPADRDRLTEPYMTTRARGTGLGLAIVKRIIEEHAGTMVLEDRPGGGARVRLMFDQDALAELVADAPQSEWAAE
jgi:two-component system nitrogen regulation sensor histidine kinase NtrY